MSYRQKHLHLADNMLYYKRNIIITTLMTKIPCIPASKSLQLQRIAF